SRHATGIAYKIQGPDDAVCDKGGRVIYFNHLPARVRTTSDVSGDKHTLHSANPALVDVSVHTLRDHHVTVVRVSRVAKHRVIQAVHPIVTAHAHRVRAVNPRR